MQHMNTEDENTKDDTVFTAQTKVTFSDKDSSVTNVGPELKSNALDVPCTDLFLEHHTHHVFTD